MQKYLQVLVAVVLIITCSYLMQLSIIQSEIKPIEIYRQIISYSKSDNKNHENITETYNEPKYMQIYDQDLIQRIKKIIIPPSQKQYNLTNPNKDPSVGQANQIRKILGSLKGGFFVECGAWDGESRSNTLMFERELGWRGLLIEADSVNYEQVLGKNRKAWSINRCLSLKKHPTKVMFEPNMSVGRIAPSTSHGYPPSQRREVECLPLYSLMLALNVTTIDYFSLDIEGDELAVLQTIPWDKLNIRTLSVESFQREISKQIIKYMNGKGYKLYITFLHPHGHDQDLIFYKNDVIPKKLATSIKWFPKYYAEIERIGCKKHVYTYGETMISP